jgi:hypothetical protein
MDESLKKALDALKAGNTDAAVLEIECSLQTLGEDLRDELGRYDWNRERTSPAITSVMQPRRADKDR